MKELRTIIITAIIIHIHPFVITIIIVKDHTGQDITAVEFLHQNHTKIMIFQGHQDLQIMEAEDRILVGIETEMEEQDVK